MSTLSETDFQGNINLVIALSNSTYIGQPILAQLTAAQAILESGLSHVPSILALKYNNLFGIKGLGTGLVVDGTKILQVTLQSPEVYHGVVQEVDSRFAVNSSVEDSLLTHKAVLSLSRYADLNTATSFEEIAQFVYEDGYATDPQYTQKLIEVYNEYIA